MTSYTATTTGNWSSAATWGGGGFPVAGDTAILPVGFSGTVTVSGAAACAVLDYSASPGTLAIGNQTLTVTGGVSLGANTTAGTGTLTLTGSQTLTSNGYTWPGKLTITSGTLTLLGNWVNTGLLTTSSDTTFNWTTNETLTLNGGVSVGNTTINGTAKIIFGGSGGTWVAGSGIINNNIDINCTSLTIGSSAAFGSGTLKYVGGTVTTTGSVFYITSSCTLDVSGINWATFQMYNPFAVTVTLSSNLNILGMLDVWTGNKIFTGANIVCGTLSASTSNRSLTLDSGRSITINTSMLCNGQINGSASFTIKSATPGTKTNVVYNGTSANCKNIAVIFTDIDASGGNPIIDYFGTLSNTTNITNVTDYSAGGGGSYVF